MVARVSNSVAKSTTDSDYDVVPDFSAFSSCSPRVALKAARPSANSFSITKRASVRITAASVKEMEVFPMVDWGATPESYVVVSTFLPMENGVGTILLG